MVSQIDEFQIQGELGRGAMGVVYRAADAAGRPVAIKVMALAAQAQPDSVARFERECQAASRLEHPNIVKVVRLGLHGAHPYMAMELVDGQDLDEHILAHGPLAPRRAAELGLQLASALHHAHERQVIHRDLKPANVMLHPSRGALLTDFGLAKVFGSQELGLTRSTDLLGSPAYMAPEQATVDHARVGARTDVYGLGTILYEMLTGKPPCWGTSLQEVMHAVIEVVPTPPSTHVPEVGPVLDAICLKCLAKDPDDRYASADEVALALDAYLLDPNRPTSTDSPVTPLLLAGLAVLVVVLGVLLALLLRQRSAGPQPPLAASPTVAASPATPAPTSTPSPDPSLRPPPPSAIDQARLLQAILDHASLPADELERWRARARDALARAPASVDAHVDLALVLLALKEHGPALATITQVVERAPNDPDVFRAWGLIALRCRPTRNQEAVRAFTRTLELEPNDLHALRGRGVAHTNLRAYAKAVADFSAWIERSPTVTAYGCRAYVRTIVRNYDGAKADYVAALALDPNHHDSLANLAELHRIQGELPQAIELLERCLRLRPQQVDLRDLLTQLLRRQKLHRRAIASAHAFEQIDPKNPKALLYRALAHLDLKEPGAALDILERLLRLDPEYLPALLLLAQAQSVRQSWEAVIQTCDRILAVKRTKAVTIKVLVTRAKACMASNKRETAIDSLTAVLAIDPGHRQALVLLAKVQHELKRWGPLIKTCDRLLALQPAQPSFQAKIRQVKAEALEQLGR